MGDTDSKPGRVGNCGEQLRVSLRNLRLDELAADVLPKPCGGVAERHEQLVHGESLTFALVVYHSTRRLDCIEDGIGTRYSSVFACTIA